MRLDFKTIVPSSFHTGIIALCRKIGTRTDPVFVEVMPALGSRKNECFANVAKKIAKDGGEPQHGWLIWEAPNILVEGEFHCTWRSPEGKLLCVSAREDNERVLAFLPDHSRRFSGVPEPHISIAWPKNKAVEKAIEIEASFQRFKNRHTDPQTLSVKCPKSTYLWYEREVEIAWGRVK